MRQATCKPGHSWFQTIVPFRSKAFEHTESLQYRLIPELGEQIESSLTLAEAGERRET